MSDPISWLKQFGELSGETCDIAQAALMLSALDHLETPLDGAHAHLAEIAATMRARSHLIEDITQGARALSDLLYGELGYDGNHSAYDDPSNADLLSVIARRRGLPVTLGILYIHAARAGGMVAFGLNAPSHFVVSLTHGGQDAIVDPFHGGAQIEPTHPSAGDGDQLKRVGDKNVLLRLQNNLKIRALEAGDHERALEIAQRMSLIAPRRADLWFDLGRINHQAGIPGAARKAYETALALAPAGEGLAREAAAALAQLKRLLN